MNYTILHWEPVLLNDTQCNDVFKAVLETLCMFDHYEVNEQGQIFRVETVDHDDHTFRGSKVGTVTDEIFTTMICARALRKALRDEKPAILP